MKKLLFSTALFASALSIGQITLEHSFPNEELTVYTNSEETYYVTVGNGYYESGVGHVPLTSVKVYNSDFSMRSEFFPEIPNNHTMKIVRPEYNRNSCIISKGIFDLDDKLDIVVFMEKSEGDNYSDVLIRIYNEEGEIVKDFGQTYYVGYDVDPHDFYVFHDSESGKNKLRILKAGNPSTTEIYTLPSTELNLKEVIEGSELKVYPNPAHTVLNVLNPKNGSDKIDVYNVNGQLIRSVHFDKNVENISVDVKSLEKGVYFLKIGNISSKFIKK